VAQPCMPWLLCPTMQISAMVAECKNLQNDLQFKEHCDSRLVSMWYVTNRTLWWPCDWFSHPHLASKGAPIHVPWSYLDTLQTGNSYLMCINIKKIVYLFVTKWNWPACLEGPSVTWLWLLQSNSYYSACLNEFDIHHTTQLGSPFRRW